MVTIAHQNAPGIDVNYRRTVKQFLRYYKILIECAEKIENRSIFGEDTANSFRGGGCLPKNDQIVTCWHKALNLVPYIA